MICTVIGARPQFIKAAVVSKALFKHGIAEEIIHTGQHYDPKMSHVFWEELEIPPPKINLEVGSGKHGQQTGMMMEKIENYILTKKDKPNALLVYGDTNSTIAGALVASKLQIPVIHVESGLRSYNRTMPEEINRIVTDHLSNILFCSSENGVTQLKSEGIVNNVFNVGDVMFDAILNFKPISDKKSRLLNILNLEKNNYVLATIHRPSNTDSNENILNILTAFSEIKMPILWPVHPRVKSILSKFKIPENLKLIDPVSYFDMINLTSNCFKIMTDSGGLQKEAYWMMKQCITIRTETEWVETLENDWNILTGVSKEKIIDAFQCMPKSQWKPLYGEGNTSEKIASIIQKQFFK